MFKSVLLKNSLLKFQTLINSIFFIDNLHENKTEVKAIDKERSFETIRLGNISSDKSNGNDYRQPRSWIQQPYIDLCDINVVSLRKHQKSGTFCILLFSVIVLQRNSWGFASTI